MKIQKKMSYLKEVINTLRRIGSDSIVNFNHPFVIYMSSIFINFFVCFDIFISDDIMPG